MNKKTNNKLKKKKIKLAFAILFAVVIILINLGIKKVYSQNTSFEPLPVPNTSLVAPGANQTEEIDGTSGLDSESGTENNISGVYDYSNPVPESTAIDSNYFDDAVFIGNSHTEGITAFSAMDNATILASKGITIDTIENKEVLKTDNGRITILDALATESFGKVYILLGANELGWVYPSEFIKHYASFIDKVKEVQPDAVIYVQSIFPVSKEKDSEGTIYNNENIRKFNALISEMAKEREVYFVDVYQAVADDEGNLPADTAKDGMHFGRKYYDKWFDYLKSHTVIKDNPTLDISTEN